MYILKTYKIVFYNIYMFNCLKILHIDCWVKNVISGLKASISGRFQQTHDVDPMLV